MKTRALSLAAAATLVLLSGSAFAHPGEGEHAPHTMTVEPVRTAAAAQKILDRERAEMELPKLMVGADAPKLAISEWVKGDSVRGFESGRTYVVEFWATWCGPCIRAFPHLSEVQAKHKDDLTIIGVNIWDRKKNRQTGEYTETMPDLIERVNTFVDGQGEKMGYTVAIEETDKMAERWMRAAGRNGIPSAFIVDGDGKIAWAGHPMTMDEPLKQVMAGEWDLEEGRRAQIRELEGSYFYPRTMNLLSDEATAEQGYELVYAMLRSPMADEAMMLNEIAWNILTSDKVAARDHRAAIAAASVAAEKTGWEDASIIDTLARGYFDAGDRDRAIELQTKALKLAEGTRMEADMEKTLEGYKNADD
jgi:thiol-disulfide isomerase/thioredoxin